MKMRVAAFLLVLACISGCGGGGTTTGGTAPPPQGTTTISGTASLGIIKRGTVKVYRLTSDNQKIFISPATTTDDTGRYSITITTPTTPIVVEVSGGTYVDEATGIQVTRSESDVLHAVVSSVGSVAQIAVTPMTELAYQLSGYPGVPLTAAGIDRVNETVSDAFNFDIITTQPVEPTVTAFRSPTTQAQKDYTLALATLSQQALDDETSINSVLDRYRNDLYDGLVSLSTANTFTAELSRFLGTTSTPNVRNQTGVTTQSTALSTFGAITVPVKLETGGVFTSGSFIKGVQLQLQLTSGISLPDVSAVFPSGEAETVTTVDKYYTSSTRTLRVGIINADPGFGRGEFMTINCDVAPGAPLDPALFTISDVVVTGQGGSEITGITVSAALK